MINATVTDLPKTITAYGGDWWECPCGNDPTLRASGHAAQLDASSIPILLLPAGMKSSIVAASVIWS